MHVVPGVVILLSLEMAWIYSDEQKQDAKVATVSSFQWKSVPQIYSFTCVHLLLLYHEGSLRVEIGSVGLLVRINSSEYDRSDKHPIEDKDTAVNADLSRSSNWDEL